VAATEQFGAFTQIFFAASSRYGEVWDSHFTYVNRSRDGDRGGAQLATGATGEVFVLWEDTRNGRPDLFCNRSLDRGATWLGADVPVSVPLQPATQASSPAVVSDARGDVYAVWVDTRDGNPGVYANRSQDRGEHWLERAVRLSRIGIGRSAAPGVACDREGGVYVAWVEGEPGATSILFQSSRDYGESWEFEPRLLSQAGATEISAPALHADPNGLVLVTWLEVRVGQALIRLARSQDHGRSWGAVAAELRASGGPYYAPSPPQLQGDRFGHVYVGWQALTGDGAPLFIVQSSADAARQFHETRFPRSSASLLPGTPWPAGRGFHMRADAAGNLYFTWIDPSAWSTGSAGVGFDRVSNYGETWLGLPRRVGLSGHPPLGNDPPLLCADEFGHVYLLWNEGVTLTAAASPFYGDGGWRYEHF
jgi:hypothetical protein